MIKNLFFLLKIYLLQMLFFVLQKVGFMCTNASSGEGLCVADWLAVVWHGLRLDSVMTSYLMLVPLAVLIVGVFARNIPFRKILTWWYAITNVVVALCFVADAMLYRFWGAKLDAADLVYAQNPVDMLASLTWWMILGGVVAVAVPSVLNTWLLRIVTPEKVEPVKNCWIALPLLLLLVGTDFVGMRGGLDESTANPGYAYFSKNQYLNHAALNPLFNMIHSLQKSENLESEFQFYDEAELGRLTSGIYESSSDVADTLLSVQRPNIILLIWEGGGELMTGDSLVAPNFARLKGEGVYFSNCYANNFRTDRGIVSIINGWPGLPTTSLMKMSGLCGKLPSIAKRFSADGYRTSFYYGGDIDFTNMRGYLYQSGYENVIGLDGLSDCPANSKWGVDDQYLLDEGVVKNEGRYFTTILTLSSHEPWEVPYRRLESDRENSFAYADSCIGRYMDQLRNREDWDNLLIVIVADHGVGRNGKGLSDAEVSRIPILWLGGAVKAPKRIDVMMNQSDLAATLLAQLGMKGADFVFSRNVMSASYRPSVALHAFKNGMNLVDTLGSSRFECVDGDVVPNQKPHRDDADAQAKALLQLIYSTTGRL